MDARKYLSNLPKKETSLRKEESTTSQEKDESVKSYFPKMTTLSRYSQLSREELEGTIDRLEKEVEYLKKISKKVCFALLPTSNPRNVF